MKIYKSRYNIYYVYVLQMYFLNIICSLEILLAIFWHFGKGNTVEQDLYENLSYNFDCIQQKLLKTVQRKTV